MMTRATASALVAAVTVLVVPGCEARNPPAAVSHLILMRLDPKTEIAASDSNRTDARFFHGVAILHTRRTAEPQLIKELSRLVVAAKDRCALPVVRDGEYGARIATEGHESQDVVICFDCRAPTIRVVGKRVTDERELALTVEQSDRLRRAFKRTFDD